MRSTILLLSLAFLVSCDNFGSLSDQEYLTRAQEYLDKGELNAATIELKNALTQNANNSQARLLLGKTYLELGNGPDAENTLKRAQELGLPEEVIAIPLGKSLLLQGKYQPIISEIQPLGSSTPDNRAKVHALRGNAFLGEGKLEEAAAEFQSAIDLREDLTEAQIGYARQNMFQGKREEARNWINKALTSDPESANAWSLLGNLEFAEGKPAEAEAAFNSAIKFRKYTNVDTIHRAMARIQLERYSDADADIQTLVQRGFKEHPYVNYVKGISLFKQKKYPDALEAFQASEANMPSFQPLEIYLATTHYILGNMEQAKSYAERVNYKSPESLQAIRLLGGVEVSDLEYGAATNILLEALNKSPDDALVLSMLGTVSLLDGNPAQSAEYYQRLVSLKPESQKVKNVLNLAKLIDGQALDEDIVDSQVQDSPESDIYTRDFLSAARAFRDGKIGEALERAQVLHEQHPERIDPINLMAACYLKVGQWDRAKTELEKALELRPNERSATRNLARLEAQQGNLERARMLLKPFVETYPEEEESILLLAGIEARLGDQADATLVLQQAVERNPNALTVIAKLAEVYLRENQVEKVLKVTQDLTEKQLQALPKLLELRGKAQMLGGDVASATRSFQLWSEAAPDSAQAHFMYGESLARSNDLKRAWKELNLAVKLDPNYLPAREAEIKMLTQLGELQGAAEALSKLKQDFGNRPEVLYTEGWFALGTGNYDIAAIKLSQALEKRPKTELVILLVRALWLQQNHGEAIGVMQEWLKTHPQDLVVRLQLANNYMTLNKKEEARAAYAHILELYPDNLIALNNLAWLSRNQDLDQAISHAKHAYQLAPKDPNVLDTYGMLLLKNGEVSRGHRMILKAAESMPEDQVIQLHLGHALVQQERYTEAQKVLNTLIMKAPDSGTASDARKLLESIRTDKAKAR